MKSKDSQLPTTTATTIPNQQTHGDGGFEAAVQALFSSEHQSTTKEEIMKAAQRRTRTVQDMREYWNCLEVPKQQRRRMKRKMIHITGTKGKGSTACFCESILRANGYSTGLFTSPHLIDIRERIRWNGRPIHPSIFGRAYWKIRNDLLEQHQHTSGQLNEAGLPTLPGYFRMLTIMAYYIFEHMLEVDVLIIEVGMGGRYDATNFWDVSPDCQVVAGVTKLDLDHTRILGNTVERIAWEKGGIFAIDKIGPNISPKDTSDEEVKAKKTTTMTSSNALPCFILDSNTPSVIRVFQSCANIEGGGRPLHLVDSTGSQLKNELNGQVLGLAGQHQYGNATLAIELCNAIVPTNDRLKTLQGVQTATWPGRCQILQQHQGWTYLLDGAHTLDSITATVEFFSMNAKEEESCVMVFNCSHERNPIELLQLLLPLSISTIYFAKSDSSRPSPIAVPTAAELLREHGMGIQEDLLEGNDTPTWQETLASIWKHLKHKEVSTTANLKCNWSARQIVDDLQSNHDPCQVLVTGSLYLVGSFLTALDWKEESSPIIE
eukprot:scaffold1567_cov102-Cylindrotheca_fusiformis.AAC.4